MRCWYVISVIIDIAGGVVSRVWRRRCRCHSGFCLHPCQFSRQTILCHQAIHPCESRGYRVKTLYLSRSSHPRFRRCRHKCSGIFWKLLYWWCRSKRCPKFFIGSYYYCLEWFETLKIKIMSSITLNKIPYDTIDSSHKIFPPATKQILNPPLH